MKVVGCQISDFTYSSFLFPSKVIIKDTSLVLTPANIKAYILMTLQGLEYMHQHWVLHRVGAPTLHTNPRVHKRQECKSFYVVCFRILSPIICC